MISKIFFQKIQTITAIILWPKTQILLFQSLPPPPSCQCCVFDISDSQQATYNIVLGGGDSKTLFSSKKQFWPQQVAQLTKSMFTYLIYGKYIWVQTFCARWVGSMCYGLWDYKCCRNMLDKIRFICGG